jgi:hypothetical protein
MTAGVFGPDARAAILEAGHGRCVGCGRPDVTTQHRRARGMGGTSDVTIGHPANGVPLCGDGVRGCHGWTEHHPTDAALLGWRLVAGELALEAPWWDRVYGWRRWVEDPEPGAATIPRGRAFVGLMFVDELLDLDRRVERLDAVARYRQQRTANH